MNASSSELFATRVANVFERIHREQMAGLPLLNNSLSVATLGFKQFEGRILGLLITPWMMSLLLFPGAQDDWENEALGNKRVIAFPSGSYKFLANKIDELGVCQMHSLHSPMQRFGNQAMAIAEATAFMDKLLVIPPEGVQDDPVDEELLGKILRGEKVPELDKDGNFETQRPSGLREKNPSPTETT